MINNKFVNLGVNNGANTGQIAVPPVYRPIYPMLPNRYRWQRPYDDVYRTPGAANRHLDNDILNRLDRLEQLEDKYSNNPGSITNENIKVNVKVIPEKEREF